MDLHFQAMTGSTKPRNNSCSRTGGQAWIETLMSTSKPATDVRSKRKDPRLNQSSSLCSRPQNPSRGYTPISLDRWSCLDAVRSTFSQSRTRSQSTPRLLPSPTRRRPQWLRHFSINGSASTEFRSRSSPTRAKNSATSLRMNCGN